MGNISGNAVYDMVQMQTIKLNIPIFDGENCNDWVYKAEQYFFMYELSDDKRVKVASFHLEGKSLVWYQKFARVTPKSTWSLFVKGLKTKFNVTSYQDSFCELAKLTQMDSVIDYKARFEEISNVAVKLSDDYRLSLFISGLKQEIQYSVRALNPLNMLSAFEMAKMYELQWNIFKKRQISRAYTLTGNFSNKNFQPNTSNNYANRSQYARPYYRSEQERDLASRPNIEGLPVKRPTPAEKVLK